MVNCGIPLSRGIEVLSKQSESSVMRAALKKAQLRLHGGEPLSKALAGPSFDRIHFRLLAVGESTGALPRVLEKLGDEVEHSERLRHQLRSALTYPAVVLVCGLALAVLAQQFVFKDLLEMLVRLQVELPWTTRVMLAASRWASKPWLYLVLAVGLWALFKGFRSGQRSQRLLRSMYYWPMLGGPLRCALSVEFARTLSLCQRTGLPLMRSLDLALDLDPVLEEPGWVIIRQVEEGKTLHEALADAAFFPPIIEAMLAAGEQSGAIPEMLERSASLCEESLQSGLRSLQAALQPLLLGVCGAVVAFIVLAVMQPMLTLVERL